jgi:hypothetical protein
MRQLRAIQEAVLSQAFVHCMSNVNTVKKREGTILSDGLNKYFLSFLYGFSMAPVWEFVTLCN